MSKKEFPCSASGAEGEFFFLSFRGLTTHQSILTLVYYPSLRRRKPTIWFLTRSNINRPVQSQKRARSLKFQIKQEEELYYPCSENKGADQLCSYCAFGFAYADCWFCDAVAHMRMLIFSSSDVIHYKLFLQEKESIANCIQTLKNMSATASV